MVEEFKSDINTAKGDWFDNWIDYFSKYLARLRNDRRTSSLAVDNVYYPKARGMFNADELIDNARTLILGGKNARMDRQFSQVGPVDHMLVFLQAYSTALVQTISARNNAAYVAFLGSGEKKIGNLSGVRARKTDSLGKSLEIFRYRMRELEKALDLNFRKAIGDFKDAFKEGGKAGNQQKAVSNLAGVLAYFIGSESVVKILGLNTSERIGVFEVGNMRSAGLGLNRSANADHPQTLNDFHYSLYHYTRAIWQECVKELEAFRAAMDKSAYDDAASKLESVLRIISDRALPRRG
ncbi:hypothetical protein COT72_03690 [archaeon CG10_big_fil_rev_8_21_14_0_10_43_11]|nr:MAG: hypothetical protein COT72_03690 [archaeon CG10_big_fil_rev_8_21_14_0_10_43_11]